MKEVMKRRSEGPKEVGRGGHGRDGGREEGGRYGGRDGGRKGWMERGRKGEVVRE